MDEIKKNERQWEREGFVFIFSDTWANDKHKLDKYGDFTKGSFSFQFGTDFSVSDTSSAGTFC